MSRNLPPIPVHEPYRDHPENDRPSSTELQDYWDNGAIPPPHRLSGSPIPNSSTESFHNNLNPNSSNLSPPNRSPNIRQLDDPFNPYPYPSTSQPQIAAEEIGHQYPTASNMNRFTTTQGYGNLNDNNESHESPWLAEQNKKNRRSKIIAIGSLVALLAVIIIGVVVGVVVATHKKSSSKTSSTSTSGSSNSNSTSSSGAAGTADPSTGYFAVVQQTNPKDPSTFVKDPNLQNAFWGVAYTPFGSILPECGANQQAVTEDIQLISQITTRLRLYGSDCNLAPLVLQAIQDTKVNLQVWLGNYVLPGDDTGYTRQRDAINAALQKYGVDHVAGITVGNEFILDYLEANGQGNMDPNSDVANQGAQFLTAKIADTRSSLASLNLGKTIPVGTSDAGAFFNNEVLAAVDYGMANVHPWFANVSVNDASSWTTQFFQNTDIAAANNVSNKPQMYIAETGWPTQSNDVGNESNGASTASVANLQTFIETFVCSANQGGTDYFFFEVFDEPWKNATFGGVEGYWGVFNFNKTLKAGITLPTCGHP